MPRPRKPRFCRSFDGDHVFKPRSIPMTELETVRLELGELEAIVHPRIAERIAERMASATSPGVVVEVPVTSAVDDRDATRVAVVASRDTRFARAVARGGDPDDVERRIEAQDTDAVWRRWADHVIENDGNWAETERAVEELIERMVADG